jgi:hypothetical protein
MKPLIKVFILCLALFTCQASLAQSETDSLQYDDEKIVKPEPDGDYRLGVIMGFQMNTLTGSEADRAQASFGLNGGMYVKRKLGKQTALQVELTGSFRGSNFKYNNVDTQYTTIRLMYIDLPVMFMYMPYKNSTNIRLLLGPYYSTLINSSLYLNNNTLPEGNKPKVADYDYGIAAAYQYHTPFVGFQIKSKVGLNNLNNGVYANTNSNGKTLNTFVLEFNLIF